MLAVQYPNRSWLSPQPGPGTRLAYYPPPLPGCGTENPTSSIQIRGSAGGGGDKDEGDLGGRRAWNSGNVGR